jgi:hypothetical protein
MISPLPFEVILPQAPTPKGGEQKKCYIRFIYLRPRVNNRPVYSIMNVHINKGEQNGTSGTVNDQRPGLH